MASMALEIGRALRRARLARGSTLKQLAAASADRFKPTSVAGYERGERSISVVRFCELCRLFGVPPDRLLGEILRAAGAETELVIDLTHLERLGPSEGELLAGFVQQVASLRGSGDVERITLRAGDVEVLASASGRRPDELKEILGTVHRVTHQPDPQIERRS
ncbi:MAG: helix-turn-helix domain-containing protein [Actinomycetota bacterium]|nr:helix-turn-helix domain-containing protein [Actinomycetota bacterium]